MNQIIMFGIDGGRIGLKENTLLKFFKHFKDAKLYFLDKYKRKIREYAEINFIDNNDFNKQTKQILDKLNIVYLKIMMKLMI